jgi:hypothetical protein
LGLKYNRVLLGKIIMDRGGCRHIERVNGVKVAHQVSEEWFPRIGLNDLEAEWVRFPLTPKNFEKIIYINIL